MSVRSEVHEGSQSVETPPSEASKDVRRNLEHGIALIVAVLFVAVAYFEGGTEPGFRAGAAIFLWLVVILGLALGRWPRAPVPRPALTAGLLLGGLAVFSGLSLFWADDTAAAFNEVIRVLVFLGAFTAVVLATSAGGARPWLSGLAIGIAAVAAIALVDRAVPNLFSTSEAFREEFPAATRRLTFPGFYWNALGLIMSVGLVLFTWLGAEGRTRLSRAAATAAMPAAGLTLYLTSSRGGVVAGAIGAVVLFALGRSRPVLAGTAVIGAGGTFLAIVLGSSTVPAVMQRTPEAFGGEGAALLSIAVFTGAGAAVFRYAADTPLRGFRFPAWAGRAALAAAAVGVLVALVAVRPIQAIERFAEPPEVGTGGQNVATHIASASGSGRVQYWESGLEAFASAPIAGIGAGNFNSWWALNHTLPRPTPFVHSIFVGALSELGIVGLALVVAFFAVVVVAGVRASRASRGWSAPAAALAVLAASLFSAAIDWMWEHPAAFAPAIVAAAILTGPALSPPPASRRGRFGYGVGALVVGWIAIVASLLSVFGEAKTGDSREALEEGDLEGAIDSAETASTLTPWSAQPYVFKAAALEGQGELAAAEEAAREAIDRDKGDWTLWAVAARINAQQQDLEAALGGLRQANRRNPSVSETPRSALKRFGFDEEDLRESRQG